MIAALNKLVAFNSLQSALKSFKSKRTLKCLNEVTSLSCTYESLLANRCIARRFSSFKRLASSSDSLRKGSQNSRHQCFLISQSSSPYSRNNQLRPYLAVSRFARLTGCAPRSFGLVAQSKRVFSQKVSIQLIDQQPKGDQSSVQQSKGQRRFERKTSVQQQAIQQQVVQQCTPKVQTMKEHSLKDPNPDSTTPNYKEAIAALNSLQSNRWEIQQRIIDKSTLSAKVQRTRAHLQYLGVDQADLAALNIVHVSGTKGKGSTCAFVESILRRKGFKTGMFVSPHLISVRERIQLDGKPIEKELFARNFFHVYNQLKRYDDGLNKPSDGNETTSIPFYFNFLTLMALYTFKQQGCSATIVEVGIGGEFDCTNVADRPAVVGVSSLGIDHVKLLGSTLPEIAWHKAGIFKPAVAAFTAGDQKAEALEVLVERAAERNCSLQICPPLDRYHLDENRRLKLGINGQVQKLNASLALQICNHFLAKHRSTTENVSSNDFKRLTVSGNNQTNNQINNQITHRIHNSQINNRIDYAEGFRLDDEYLEAIEECKWRGRCEVIPLKNKSTFYLDGAHTVESLTHCIDWFRDECSSQLISDKKPFKILIFNCTGYRDYKQLLSPLLNGEKFDLICFTTNLKTVEELNNTNSDVFYAAEDSSNRDQFKEEVLKSLHFTGTVRHFDCLENCLKDIHVKNEANLINNLQTKVLGCGSIHLVGGIMSLLNERYT